MSSFFLSFIIWKYLPREILGIFIIIIYESSINSRKKERIVVWESEE